MDAAGVDIAVITLSAPNVVGADVTVSREAAKQANDAFADEQVRYPDRIRWMASLPWEYPDAALTELERARNGGAANDSFGNVKFPLRGVPYGINGGFYYFRAGFNF